LPGNGVGAEVIDAFELKLHIQIGVVVVVQNGRYCHVQGNFGFGQYFVESVFVDANGLSVFQGGNFAVAFEVTRNQQFQGELYFSLLVARCRDVLDVDALFGRDRAVSFRHGKNPFRKVGVLETAVATFVM
jgi:hypothetical protein